MTEPHPDFRIIPAGATVGSGKGFTRSQVCLLREAMHNISRQFSKDLNQIIKDKEPQANVEICKKAIEEAVVLEQLLDEVLSGVGQPDPDRHLPSCYGQFDGGNENCCKCYFNEGCQRPIESLKEMLKG